MTKLDKASPEYQRAIRYWLRDNPNPGRVFNMGGLKHGFRRGQTYETWANLKRRAMRQEITLAVRWYEFENFLADMGEKPDGYVLRRVVGRDTYHPATCVWRPIKERQDGVPFYRFDPTQDHAIDDYVVQWMRRDK